MTHYWRVKTRLPERYGQQCWVPVRAGRNSILVEFADGYRVVTSRNNVRRLQAPFRCLVEDCESTTFYAKGMCRNHYQSWKRNGTPIPPKRTGNPKHGHSPRSGWSPTYTVWVSMVQRCTVASDKSYPDYGGRGIRVCVAWLTFENFLADVGERPEEPPDWNGQRSYWTLDRIDNDGHYEPGNVRWTTWKIQNNNKRKRVPLPQMVAGEET